MHRQRGPVRDGVGNLPHGQMSPDIPIHLAAVEGSQGVANEEIVGGVAEWAQGILGDEVVRAAYRLQARLLPGLPEVDRHVNAVHRPLPGPRVTADVHGPIGR